MAASVSIKGLSTVQQILLNLVPKTKTEVKQVTEWVIRLAEADAKRRVRVDTGKTRQSIGIEIVNNGFGAILFCDSPIGIYLEFGTGGLVDIPPGFEELAAEGKGKGIRKVNLPPRPFLIPAFLVAQDVYYKGLQEALDRIFR